MTSVFSFGRVKVMNLKLKARLLRAKSILNQISDISYSYSQLEKEFGVSRVQGEESVKELLDAYNQLIQNLRQVIINYEAEDDQKET